MTTSTETATRTRVQYTVVLIPEDEGGFFVMVPALTGCFSQGSTREEALERVQEAIEVHIEGLRADGEPVPMSDVLPVIERVEVEV